MKLVLQFGPLEPKREVNWWQAVQDFPSLVIHKNKKWEFVMYQEDPLRNVDYICYFSEINTFDPNYHAVTYKNIDEMFDTSWGSRCECGAIYTSFKDHHMFFCPKWTRF
jgi:hypothetical protein